MFSDQNRGSQILIETIAILKNRNTYRIGTQISW